MQGKSAPKSNRSEAVKELEKSPKRKKYFLVIKHLRARISGAFNFFTASQSRRVGRVCPQRAGPRSRKYGGALRTDAPYPTLLLRHYSCLQILVATGNPFGIFRAPLARRGLG